MRVFVINAYEDRKFKYDEERYELFDAVWWEDVEEDEIENYYLRYNAKIDLRKKVVACSMSHKKLLQKIINEDLKQIVIIEDDAVIKDWKRLEQLKDLSDFCYLGGYMSSPYLKDLKTFEDNDKEEVRHNLIKGINTIDPKIFRIGQTCGYYIPDAEVARMILSNLPNGKKERAIDNEYMALQKKGNIEKFLYPAIAVLHIEDAKKGFTFSNNKLYGDQSLY
jgi:GR25 family glycosyltransferase involved in LPS biosynthesis